MSTHFIRAATLAALGLALSPALAQQGLIGPAPAPVQGGDVTAYLGRTVSPGSSESVSFWVGQGDVEINEYRLRSRELEDALRPSALVIDPLLHTARRTVRATGPQASIEINRRAGVYVYVATNTTDASRTQAQAVVVSDLRLGIKRDDDSSIVMVHDDGTPGSYARVKVYQSTQHDQPVSRVHDGQANYWGLSSFSTPKEGSLVYVARDRTHVAIVQAWDRSYSTPPAFVGHAQTDRPLYRPGHEVHFKGVIRETLVASSSYRTPNDEPVRAFLRSPNGERVSVGGALRTNRYGSVAGSITLSDAADLGEYTLEIEAGPAPTQGFSNRVVARANFGVQAFRKPEFKVEIHPQADTYVLGQTLQAELSADYFFGAPVPGAKASYTVVRRNRFRWWNPWIRPMVARIWMPPWRWQPDTVIAQGEVTLDNAGHATISVPTTRGADTFDSDYTITAKVTDASNREVSGSGTVAVTRAAFDLLLQTDRYVYEPNDLIRLQANAATTSGDAVAGVDVTVSIDQIDPDGTTTPRFERTYTTDSDGSAGVVLRARTRASFQITVTASDAAGNDVSATRTIWIHDRQGGIDYRWNRVEVVADKDVYEVGDQAAVLIRAPISSGVGVLTVESGEMHRRMAFRIVGGLGLATFEVNADMSPNAFISVMVPTENGITTGQVELQVPPVDKVVDVQIVADKAEYRPGETATFALQAVDSQGRPVQAEIALGVVDEALFALREDGTTSLTDTFFARRWDQVTTSGTQSGGGWGGPRVLHMAAPEATNAHQKSVGGQGEQQVREFFADTLRWIAQVETDAQGRALITQELADNLTTWRLTARAITADSRFGETNTTTLVSKDLILRLATPRTLVEGDELELVGVIHNLAEAGTPGADNANVRVRLQADGVTLLDGASQTVSVLRDGQGTVSWRVRVDRAGEATFEASADASFDSDALRLKVPVAARGVADPVVEGGQMLQDGSVTLSLDKNPGAIDAATELRIELTPSLAGTLLDSLDYLTGYPYGCIEQTMSRFMPDVIVAEVLRTMGREDPTLSAELPKMVKAGVERIQGMQNADGGFGWFSRNESHPYVSAYVCYGLALARRNGHEVPDALYDGLTGFLANNLDKVGGEDDSRAYQLFALAQADVFRTQDMIDVASRSAAMNDYAKGALALALSRAGETSMASDLVGQLKASAIRSNGRTHWDGARFKYGNWINNTIEATAYVLMAFLEVDPQDARVSEAVAWLLQRRRTNGQYTTTKDTAAVVLAFSKYVEVTHELDPDLEVTAVVNGRSQTVRFTASDLGKEGHTITIAGRDLPAGPNTIELTRSGRGALYYSVTLDQTVRMNPIPARDEGISLTREYFKVSTSVDANGQIVEDVTPLTGSVALGETVRVQVTMQISRPGAVEHVNVEDRFPVGFEVVQERSPFPFAYWRSWRSAKEVHDDRVVFFATRLPQFHPESGARNYEYSYDLRAEVAGTFLALPTVAEAVYAPDTFGRSAAQEIVIR